MTRPTLSVQLRNFADQPDGWNALFDQARAADDAGIDKVVVSDHIAYGNGMDAYADPSKGGTVGGRQPTGPDGHWLEPLTTLSFVAARTERIRVGTSILLAALRRPAVLAKTAATIDALSGGRLELGVGVGWQAEEYELCGLDFADRGRLLDHTLEVCRSLWTEQPATYHSGELSFTDIHTNPKPAETNGVPIWVSGTVNRRVARRLAEFGTGWIPWGPAMADPVAGIGAMRSLLADLGHDPTGLQVVGSVPLVRTDAGVDLAASVAGVPALLDAGVTDFRLHLPVPAGHAAAADLYGEAVDAFHEVTGR